MSVATVIKAQRPSENLPVKLFRLANPPKNQLIF